MSWRSERARVASLTRSRSADDPDLVAARLQLKAEKLAEDIGLALAAPPLLSSEHIAYLRRVVDAAPLLSGGAR